MVFTSVPNSFKYQHLNKLRRTQSEPYNFATPAESPTRPEVEDGQTLVRMFVVGGLAGVCETFIVQPLVYWKTITQLRQHIDWRTSDPRKMYESYFLVGCPTCSTIETWTN